MMQEDEDSPGEIRLEAFGGESDSDSSSTDNNNSDSSDDEQTKASSPDQISVIPNVELEDH